MNNTTATAQPTTSHDSDAVGVQQKLPYASPVLQVFGAVGKLTQGAGSQAADLTSRSGDSLG
jgi:hypothetical protein